MTPNAPQVNTTGEVMTADAPPRAGWGWCALWMALALLLFTPLVNVKEQRGNVQSDLAAIESLVVRGTFFIDGSPFEDTIDKFRREDGRFFSQKSPIFHLAAAVPAKALHALGYDFVRDRTLFLVVLTLCMVIVPMGWMLGLVFDHPWLRRRPLRDRVVLTGLLALGSLLTPFAVTLNHYTLAAAALLAAVRILTPEPGAAARPLGLKGGAVVGFLIALSLASDVPPAFLFGAGLGAIWLVQALRAAGEVRRRAWQRLAGLALGAAPLLLLYAGLNVAIIGSPLPPNLHEEAMLYYPGSYWSEIKAEAEAGRPGYYQASYSRRLYHAVLGHKGILWMWPLLTLALFAAVRLVRERAEAWPLALAWALFPFVTIAVTMRWAFDLSGGAYGIRHAFAALPPLYCVLGHPALRPGRAARALVGVLGAAGVAIALVGLINPWSANVVSAYPPLENLARVAMAMPTRGSDRWVDKVIDITSVTPEVGWLDLGMRRVARGDLTEAERSLVRAIQFAPDKPLPYNHLGTVLDMQGQPAAAIAVYQRLLEIEPDNLSAWNNLGLFALHAGRRELALQAFARSEALAPENATLLLGRLMLAELDEGRLDPQDPRLRRALELYPNDHRIHAIARGWAGEQEKTNEPLDGKPKAIESQSNHPEAGR